MVRSTGLVLVIVLNGSFLAMAQGERGTFNGTVTDTSGAGVPGANVIALEVQTRVEARTRFRTCLPGSTPLQPRHYC